mmetsp:Transcript_48360/g.98758  ORF Transcript_48360/g.98758 Transcript_48360/m.98758 type:complete len:204 (+) Transcript_48360:79-690(+)
MARSWSRPERKEAAEIPPTTDAPTSRVLPISFPISSRLCTFLMSFPPTVLPFSRTPSDSLCSAPSTTLASATAAWSPSSVTPNRFFNSLAATVCRDASILSTVLCCSRAPCSIESYSRSVAASHDSLQLSSSVMRAGSVFSTWLSDETKVSMLFASYVIVFENVWKKTLEGWTGQRRNLPMARASAEVVHTTSERLGLMSTLY